MRPGRTITMGAVLVVLFAACGGDGSVETTQETDPVTTVAGDAPPPTPPELDMTRHDVPLDEIYFDTFDGNSVPLSESTPELRRRLLDAIPPIDEPTYGGVSEGEWLEPDDPVLGYISGDQAYAYPFKILNFHEIVNDTIDGVPVLISYCPLCRSAIVYDRRVDGRELSFGNTSALYESDLVMVDRNTGSYWWQVPGTAIVGPMTGTRLELLPSSVARWEDWKTEHPRTLVLTRDTGYQIDYERDPFANYDEYLDSGRFAFPVGDDARDDRLPPSALVVGVSIGDETRAYPVEGLDAPINDQIDGEPVVILPTGGGASVFSPVVDGQALEFEKSGEAFVDTSTRSTWSAGGRAVSGPMEGAELEPIPSRTTFWFALVGAYPDVMVAG